MKTLSLSTLGLVAAFVLLAPCPHAEAAQPVITLNGGAILTNECHFTFTDPGATVTGVPLPIAGGGAHSLAIKSDGTVTAWGYNGDGRTNVPVGLSNVVAIAGGNAHSLALKSDGTVSAWGFNSDGQTDIPVGLSNVVAIATRFTHNLALKSDGTVAAWGDNSDGQTDIPVGLSNVVAIAAIANDSLALKSDGTVVTWGGNPSGQTNIPVGLSNVVAIAGGGFHSLALKSDGTVAAWGWNNSGQTNIPLGLSNVVAIAAGAYHNLALKSDGNVVAWGANFNNYGETTIPVGLSNVVVIAAGFYHSLALKSDGTLVAWGAGTTNTGSNQQYGQSIIPAGLSIARPVTVSGSVNTNSPGNYSLTYTATNFLGGIAAPVTRTVVVQDSLPPVITLLGANPLVVLTNSLFVDPGATALDACGGSFAVTTNSTVINSVPGTYAVHYSATDGNGYTATNTRVVQVIVPPPVITLNGSALLTNECHTAFTDLGATATGAPLAIAAGEFHSLALKSDGKVTGWGLNDIGQTNIPVGLSNVVAIAGGGFHNLALKNDGKVAAWGYNSLGQTTIPSGLSNVVAIAGGSFHSLALKNNGTVLAWGWNNSGQTNIPVGLSNVVAIAAGASHSLALKSDGTVAAWGWNDHGQTNIPVGLSNVVAIAGGYVHNLALKSDGKVVAWGSNTSGQTNIPVGLSNVVAVAGGVYHSLALKRDGTVAVWGRNVEGQTNMPVGLSNVVAIAGGGYHSLALKRDGTVVAWGAGTTNTGSGFDYGQSIIPAGLSISLPVTVSGSVDTNTPGTYTLTYTATNIHGGIGTVSRTVVVQDTLPPVITMLGANPVTLFTNTPFIDPGATALDACGGSIAVTTNSTVYSAVPGRYAVGYTATDGNGNVATSTRVVQVILPQVITRNGDAVITNECHAAFTDPGAAATGLPIAIAAGGIHNLALKSDGKVAAWGSSPGSGVTNIPVGLSNVVAIAGGSYHSLALKTDGKVVAWGANFNDYGQTTIPVGLSNVVAIAGGLYHSLALKSDGTVAAWGNDGNGQTTIPVGLSNVVAIAGGGSHSLALKSDGTVAAWGYNAFGQTNIPVGLSISLPITVSGSLNTNSPGSYLLTYTATNIHGGTATTNRTVVVQDTLPPVITMLGANPMILVTNTLFVDPGATALDACDGSFAVTTNGTVNVSVAGTYTVRYSATDGNGYSATNTRTVLVYDFDPMVMNTNDSGPGSLRQTVANVATGATVTFTNTLSGKTILLTSGPVLLNKSFNIDGSALAGGIIINGNQTGGVFDSITGITNVFTALTITNGVTASGGGGIVSRGNLTVNRCTLVGNSADLGGGIYNEGALTLNNSTFANNSASNAGGGIYNTNMLTVNNSTLANNSAINGGGILNLGTLNLTNSIVCSNTASVAGPNIDGSISSSGSNLVDANALLAPFGNYGGPTLTMPPLPGSPAVDAGVATTLTTDQRGFARPVGAQVDIGAVEFSITESWLQAFPLRWAVGSSNWNAVAFTWTDLANGSVLTNYSFGRYLVFNDLASGASPILVTNTLAITNGGILFSNAAKAYTLSGAGVISNNVSILKLGTGTVTIASTNTLYGGQFTLGQGKLVLNTGSSLGSASSVALLVMSNNTAIQIGDTGNATPSVPILIAAGANVTNTANALGSGANGSITSEDSTCVINDNSSFTYGGNFQTFTGTLKVNSGTTRFGISGSGPILGSSNASFIVNSSSPGLQPRNHNTTVHLGALSGTGTLAGSQTTTGPNTTTYQIGALNLSTTFGGRFVDNISPSTNVAIIKVGTGTLTLTNHSPHSGATIVSNGMLTLVTSGSLSNSAVTLASGATNGVTIAAAGGSTTVSNLTYAVGTTTVRFDFGANLPSASVAPLRVKNNVAVNGTLNVIVTGTNFPNGTYPLVSYTGTFSGTPPALPFSLPSPVGGYLTNITAGKVMALVVTNGNVVLASTPPVLINPVTLGNGSFQFNFISDPGALLTVWASTNVALPFNAWSNLGAPVESPAGTFQFTDLQATNNVMRFYRLRSP
ncbi:MAG: DUF5011 domain-containing protein [Verrucomicrobiota bacterium]